MSACPCPIQVVDNIVYWNVGHDRVAEARDVVEPPESVVIRRTQAAVAEALADVSISQIIRQVGREKSGIPAKDPFAVGGGEIERRLSGKLRRVLGTEILQVPFHEQSV